MAKHRHYKGRRKPEPQLKWLERGCDDLVTAFVAIVTEPFRVFMSKLKEDNSHDQRRNK